MKIFVKVKPRAYKAEVIKIDETHYEVSVEEPPANGLANRGVVKALSDYLGMAPTRVVLKKGFSSKLKVFEIV